MAEKPKKKSSKPAKKSDPHRSHHSGAEKPMPKTGEKLHQMELEILVGSGDECVPEAPPASAPEVSVALVEVALRTVEIATVPMIAKPIMLPRGVISIHRTWIMDRQAVTFVLPPGEELPADLHGRLADLHVLPPTTKETN